MTMTPDDQINVILDRFDFDRVHRAMVALNWTWSETEEGRDRVPTKPDLRRTARQQLRLMDGRYDYCSSGGFVARRDEDGSLSLEFVIESVAE